MDIESRKVKSLDRHSPTPLYRQLSDVLTDEIKKGVFKPGDLMPSESELMSVFGVSRHVIRQAMRTMARRGKIYTEQGKGSFVARERIEKSLGVLESYHASMQKSGFIPEVIISQKEIITAPDNVVAEMGISEGTNLFHLQRISYLDNMPINLLDAYIVPGDNCMEKLMQFSGGSLYAHLEKYCNIQFVRCRFNVEVVFANDFESRLLSVPRDSVLMKTASVSLDRNHSPVEYSVMIHPANLFRFYFESSIDDPVHIQK
jgi:GntR family transcriptional regulator